MPCAPQSLPSNALNKLLTGLFGAFFPLEYLFMRISEKFPEKKFWKEFPEKNVMAVTVPKFFRHYIQKEKSQNIMVFSLTQKKIN